MMNDEEKAEFRALLVDVLQTEVRAIMTDVVGAAFSESQRLTGEQLRELEQAIGELNDSRRDRLDVLELDVGAARRALARIGRRLDDLEAKR